MTAPVQLPNIKDKVTLLRDGQKLYVGYWEKCADGWERVEYIAKIKDIHLNGVKVERS